MFNWIKKKGKDTSDFGKKVVGTEEIVNSFDQIKDMASSVLSPKKQIKNAKNESFVEAKQRLHVSDADLLQNYKNYVYCFYISIAFSVLCFAYIMYNLFINQQFFSSLVFIAVFLLCMANAFKFSFRAFQIKHQKLCSVKDWWDRASEWFPVL